MKYLPQLIEKGEKINTSTLYETTIEEELKRRLKVGKTVIQKEDRTKLMKLLAMWMYNHDKLSVHYEDIPELLDLKMHFDLKTRTSIEYHLNDFLTCSFLSRDAEGNYRFSHRSFVDFLVACKFIEDIEEGFKDDFVQKKITYEVMQFMKDSKIHKGRLYEWIKSTRKRSFPETQYLGGNAVSVLNEFGVNFAKKRFDFQETVLDYADFHGLNLQELNFQNASLKHVNLNNAHLVDSDFSFADLEGASFEEMNKISCVCWSPDGKYLVSGDEGGILKVWDRRDFKEFITLRGHVDKVFCVAYSPDGKYLASGDRDKKIRIWDMNTYEHVATLEGHTDYVYGVVYGLDGKYLVSGSEDRTVRIWDMNIHEEIGTFEAHAEVSSLAYSPDGKYLASGGWDGTVRIWNMNTYKAATLEGHTQWAWSTAYSPDGKYLASGGWDGTVRIWDMNTYEHVATLEGHTDSIWSTAYSPDGKYLASGSSDKTVRIWDVDKKSRTLGKCCYTIIQQINCGGMKIKGVRGLGKEEIKFLKERGAIDHII